MPEPTFQPDLLLIFGSRSALESYDFSKLNQKYPDCIITGCSSSGSIGGSKIYDDELIFNYIDFEKTAVRQATCALSDVSNSSFEAGRHIAQSLMADDLKHLFVLSDGLSVNGTALIQGMQKVVSNSTTITGGLAGDGDRFEKTLVINPKTLKAESNILVGIGFYGDHIHVGYGSQGGWESFGIDRTVTRSKENVLYEIDGQPALVLYKSFLGEKAAELPASALLFPLSMEVSGHHTSVVRTILSIDEKEQSMTFAGDIPMGATVRLMKSNNHKLVNGAVGAAQDSKKLLNKPNLAILVSCVGRRLVLRQLAEEEVEAVQDELSTDVITGFYSYGELAPSGHITACELHNQTMTITTFSEL